MREPTIVTTSWDDGARHDIRLAHLLTTVGLKGTFYVSRATCELRASELREISELHEIGSHTLSHAFWGSMSARAWSDDLRDGRQWLEDLLGQSVPAFAYPGGVFDRRAVEIAQEHVESARTTLLGSLDLPVSRHSMPTTVHACFFSLAHRASGLRNRWHRTRTWSLSSWPVQTERALAQDPTALHLWGHSWEIDKQQSWGALAQVLARINDVRHSSRTVSESLAP